MRQLYRENKIVFIVYILIFVFCFFIIVLYPKTDIHISINKVHFPFFDFFFKYFTNLGDAIFAILVGVLFVLIKYRKSLIIILSYLVSGLIVQVFKRLIFNDHNRPAKVLEGIYDLYFVSGVDIHTYKSFPSGHTTTAFALFFSLIIFTKNQLLKAIFFIAAILVAYSRMYLSQHFLIDVWAGSIIGIVSTIAIYYYFGKFNKNWLDNSILRNSSSTDGKK